MPDGKADTEALAAADRWLALIDRGDAEASWAAAAKLLQGAVDQEKWAESLRRAQSPIGRARSRDVRSVRYATELPGAPDGEYVVVEYGTEFERKRNGTEQLTLMKEPDGEWRVAGYYVR